MISRLNFYLIHFLYSGTFFCISLCASGVPANTVVATINVGVTPAGMAFTPNSKYVYVANENNYGVAGHDAMGQDNISVINVSTKLVVKTIYDASFAQPSTVAINPAGTKAYATNSNGQLVTIIDIETNTVSGTIAGFDGPTGMAINAAGTIGYVNNYGAGHPDGSGNGHTISVVNLNTNVIDATIDLTPHIAPAAVALTPNGKYLYVINYENGNPGTGTVSVIRTSDNTIVDTITGFSGPFAIAISSNGKFAYVTDFGSNNFFPYGTTVSVIDLSNNTISSTIVLGIQPAGVAVTPGSDLAYVSIYNTLYNDTSFNVLFPGQGVVNVVNLANNRVLPVSIAVDQSPGAVVISPNGEYAYVSNYTSNTVNVIALQSFQIVASGCKTYNRYLNQIDCINKLTWTVTGTSLPVTYFIYRDAALTDLVGTIDGSDTFEFFDHNRNPNIDDTYYIVGINAVGTLSDPVMFVVSKNCRFYKFK